MTPEQLWKSLEPQVEEIERELMSRENIADAMFDAMLTGAGLYSIGVDPASMTMVLAHVRQSDVMISGHPDQMQPTGRQPGLVIIDECEPLMSAELEEMLIQLGRSSKGNALGQGIIVIGGDGYSDRGFIEFKTSSRRRAGSLALAALAMEAIAMPDISWLMKAEPPPGDPWHQKPLSKKNYAAPRQSFRGRMRSVNRNR
jgi:hypothetical protein